jgi:putative restriction endonuclease
MNFSHANSIVMAGQLHGWEIATQGPDSITLTSENHKDSVVVRPSPSGEAWLIDLQSKLLAEELAHIRGATELNHTLFSASSEKDLAELLAQASRLARTLADRPRLNYQQAVAEQLFCISEPHATSALRRLVRERVAIEVHRATLMDYWGGACAVTGISILELLRAPHAKPLSECETDVDRFSVFYGFLLVANLEVLFSRHLLTFGPCGKIQLAPVLSSDLQRQLSISTALRLRWISPSHEPFLSEHRKRFCLAHNTCISANADS